METIQQAYLPSYSPPVLTVPMRNGNVTLISLLKTSVLVLTVPMRNGNHLQACFVPLAVHRSYRTYEEWKRTTERGIDKSGYVLTVPMRNGNEPLQSALLSCFFRVLTVPMRNGNTSLSCPYTSPAVSSYRTYEEWKRGSDYVPSEYPYTFLPYL